MLPEWCESCLGPTLVTQANTITPVVGADQHDTCRLERFTEADEIVFGRAQAVLKPAHNR